MIEKAWHRKASAVYTIQAAIASVHAHASSASATDWNRIVGCTTF